MIRFAFKKILYLFSSICIKVLEEWKQVTLAEGNGILN